MQADPWYLLDHLVGYEDDAGSDSSDDNSDADDDTDDDTDDDDASSESDSGEGGEKPPTQADLDNLKKALRAERQQRREAQRELKKLGKSPEQKKEAEEEAEQLRQQVSAGDEKSGKLAAKLLRNTIDGAIVKEATKLKFRDVDDAVSNISRDDIDWEQDEDDPSEVTVDSDSVKDAVKALAKAKPYLIQAPGEGGGGDASGSSFGGGRSNKSGQELSDETLMTQYPALRRGVPAQ